jgi:hypothetical protein
LCPVRNTEAFETRWTLTFFSVFFISRLKCRNRNLDRLEVLFCVFVYRADVVLWKMELVITKIKVKFVKK